MNMNNLLNKYEALESALRYIDLDPNAVRVLSVSLCGAHYEVILRSDWMEYDCFVGCVSGNVAGLDYFPHVDADELDGVPCSEYLGAARRARRVIHPLLSIHHSQHKAPVSRQVLVPLLFMPFVLFRRQ